MEYEEVATVRNFRRQLEFPRLKWLEKSKFEEYLKENRPIYPYMIPEKNGDKVGGSASSSADDNADEQTDRRIFIGRSIDTHVTEGALYGFDHYTDSHLRLNLELVGTVSCCYSKNQNYFPNGVYGDSISTNRRHNQNKLSWKLSVCNSNKVYEIYENFLVLCLDTESAYEWKNCALFRPLVNQSYPHPVGACVDRTSDDLAYIGRVRSRHGVTDHFGQVCLRNREFNGVTDDVDFTTHEYEVLCLRPTPSKLKVQCRELIRNMCNRSNERMDQLASELPRSLVNYVKYGSYVSVGECVIRGEKLVSYDQSFELEFKQDTGLAYRPLKLGRQLIDAARPIYNKIKKFKCCFYNYFEDRSPFRDVIFTYPAVESIWLLSNKIVVHTSDGKTRVTYNYGLEHPKYVLTFDCFTMIENFLNNTSANVFRRRRIKHL